MPIRKELTTGINQGRLIIWPSPSKTRGGIEVLTDLDEAKKQARRDANRFDQYRYVVSVLDGYVVVGYADLWDYFGDLMELETVYKVDAPGTDRGKKWPGES